MSDTTLTPRERALIRNEFMVRFAQAPRLETGILVKRWATGPNKGQPKPGTVIQGMLDRGLLELRDDGAHWLRARFTEAGLAALRHMAEVHARCHRATTSMFWTNSDRRSQQITPARRPPSPARHLACEGEKERPG